jgi:L-cysteine desulfidase
MQASMLAGIVGGDSDLGLEVLSRISDTDKEKINSLMNTGLVQVEQLDTDTTLHFIIKMTDGIKNVEVEIKYAHTNVVRVSVDGVDVVKVDNGDDFASTITNRDILSIDQILNFVEEANMKDYKDLLQLQIDYNMAISKEGLTNEYGINVGKSIIKNGGDNIESKVKGNTAAGSDARMAGSTLPVVTNSGSGNQGMTCSIPVITYALEKKYSQENMFKALLLSNLVTIHIKTGLTRLSCYCGAVVAASGAAAGMVYLDGGSREQIKMSITNVLGDLSGVICDGAKESCATKIASAVDSAIMGKNLAFDNKVYGHGCGIVEDDVEATIQNVGKLGALGMKGTDDVILDIMTHITN